MPVPKANTNFVKREMKLNMVRRGFNPGMSEARVNSIRVGATREARMEQIRKIGSRIGKVNLANAGPKRLFNMALMLISIEELSTVRFGPKNQPVLYGGPMVNGLPTGLRQELENIVGRAQKRVQQGKPELLTAGEMNYLKQNLPNVGQRIDQFLKHQ